MGVTVTKRDQPKYIPAHECVRLGICFLCGAPCDVPEREEGHIAIPWCGCGKVEVRE